MEWSIVDNINATLHALVNVSAHLLLGVDNIGDNFGERAIVTDRSRQDDVDAVLHAVVHHTRRQHTAINCLTNPADRADAIDRAQVVLVTRLDGFAAIKGNTKRGAIERAFDVVRCERVASEKHIDVAAGNELTEVIARCGVNDRRAATRRFRSPAARL